MAVGMPTAAAVLCGQGFTKNDVLTISSKNWYKGHRRVLAYETYSALSVGSVGRTSHFSPLLHLRMCGFLATAPSDMHL